MCDDTEEEYLCEDCKEYFYASSFDDTEETLHEQHPRCRECQAQHDIDTSQCEYCDNPATTYVGNSTYLCDDCTEDYIPSYD